MLYCFDRLEEGFAVLEGEDGQTVNISADCLSDGAKCGDWGEMLNGVFCPDEAVTRQKRAETAGLLAILLKKDK